MSLICGVDEAGYGPLIGPLVVTAAVFRHPSAASPAAFREVWNRALTSSGAAAEFRVADSKRLHRGERGMERLERELFPFLCLEGAPATFAEVLRRCAHSAPRLTAEMARYPWHEGGELKLPLAAAPKARAEHARRAALLAEAMAAGGLDFVGFRAEIVEAGRFNAEIGRLGNKATLLWSCIAPLLRWALEVAPAEETLLQVDRLGGRAFYGPLLRELAPNARLETLEESPRVSAYRFRERGRTVTARFEVGADAEYAVVALASMFGKYARELCMLRFNDFWTRRLAGLTPTAGYYTDGLRFLREIEPLRKKLEIPETLLRRCR